MTLARLQKGEPLSQFSPLDTVVKALDQRTTDLLVEPEALFLLAAKILERQRSCRNTVEPERVLRNTNPDN